MEVSDLISCTKNCSWIDACLELPPNQQDPVASNLILLGKLITHKNVGTSIVSEVVNKAWKPTYQIRVDRLDKNIFMFHFNHEADLSNAFRRRPWSIRGGHLVLKQWNPSLAWQEIPFSTSTFWVQVHGLPELWKSPSNLRRLGEKVGSVIDLDLAGEGGGAWRKFIRIQVEVDLLRPLMPGIFLTRGKLPHLWVSFRYEKLADVCYQCGIIGHKTQVCQGKTLFIHNPFGFEFIASGPWLRSESRATPQDLLQVLTSCTPPCSSTGTNPTDSIATSSS